MQIDKSAVLILNWNNPEDTIACLQSILCLNDLGDVDVFIIDNGSTDDSVQRFEAWGRTSPAQIHGFDSVLIGADRNLIQPISTLAISSSRFHLVKCERNHLYSGGNNVGLRLARGLDRFNFFWLLNNDTLVFPETFTHLREAACGDSKIGLVGSTLVYKNGFTVQALGGAEIIPWRATTRLLGNLERLCIPPITASPKDLDCIVGASMLITRDFLDIVGMIEEGFGMYFEEPDLGLRGKTAGFQIVHAAKSIVIHKEGGTISSDNPDGGPSVNQAFWSNQSRLLFIWKHYPWYIINALFFVIFQSLRFLLSCRVDLFVASIRGAKSFIKRLCLGEINFTN